MQIEYEDDNILVINKLAGLPVYSTKKHAKEDSVLKWFLQKYPKAKEVGSPDRPGIVHRLDKQTSGLLLLAKTSAGYDYLGKIFRSRDIVKEYLVLVWGKVETRHGFIRKPLSKIGHEGQSRVRVDEQGKDAVTEYWVKNYYHRGVDPVKNKPPLEAAAAVPAAGRISNGVDQFTFLRVRLHTGRTHQIRVHFSSTKHPVMGDNLYGKPQSQKLKDILSRMFLHASRIELKLPDGTWLDVEAELPEDLKTALIQLNKLTI